MRGYGPGSQFGFKLFALRHSEASIHRLSSIEKNFKVMVYNSHRDLLAVSGLTYFLLVYVKTRLYSTFLHEPHLHFYSHPTPFRFLRLKLIRWYIKILSLKCLIVVEFVKIIWTVLFPVKTQRKGGLLVSDKKSRGTV